MLLPRLLVNSDCSARCGSDVSPAVVVSPAPFVVQRKSLDIAKMEFEAEVTRDSIASLDRAVSDMQDFDELFDA